MTVPVSVVICSHNPRVEYLSRVLLGLRNQTLPQSEWELLIIDNGSAKLLTSDIVGWHSNGKLIREETLGLTHARLRGIRESIGDIIIFVDDDNVLQEDYIATACHIAREYSFIGAWSGQCHPEFEIEPEAWVHRYRGMLVIREFNKDNWSNLSHVGESMPCGAGLCVRRAVANAYLTLHESGQRPMLLDRQGTSLMSAGDNDLSACACDIGLGVGLFHKLELMHLISAGRMTEEYLLRLADGIYYSAIYLRAFRGEQPLPKSWPKRLLEFFQSCRMSASDRRMFAACCRGENRALRELAKNPIRVGQHVGTIR
jgi:glycosyltransferase involved in cell wall biosynthesis